MPSKNYIYGVKKATFDIGGTEYDVSTAAIMLSTNSIPTCQVGIAPTKGSSGTNVHVLDLNNLKSALDMLSYKAAGLEECNLDIVLEIVSEDGKGTTQELKLEKWLIADVGLYNVSTTGIFDMAVTIMHPAYRLLMHSGFYFDASNTLNFDKTYPKVTDPLNAAEVAIDTMKAANEKAKLETQFSSQASILMSTPLKSASEFSKELLSAMDAVKADMKHLIFDLEFSGATNKLPCETILKSRYINGVKYALADMWTSALQGGNSSFWSALTGSICPQMMLEVIPTFYEDKLHVVPIMPWKSVSVKLYDFNENNVNLPSKDPDPIYGCIMYNGPGATPAEGTITYARNAGEKTGIQTANLAFIPSGSDSSVGRLLPCGDPPWIHVANEKASSMNPVTNTATGENSYSKTKTSNSKSGGNEDLKMWNAVRILYMNSLFMSEYRSGVSASLSGAFCTAIDGDNWLIPGKRASFISGNELFTGQIATVQHNIDCARSSASTNIQLSYCLSSRSSANILGDAPKIPFYNAHAASS